MIDLGAARRLGLLDRELGVAEQFLGILARLHHRQPDRAFDPDLQVAQFEWRGHHFLDSVGGLHRIVHALAKRDDDPEFVAPGARQPVARPQRGDQPPGEGDEQFVANQPSHALVDPAEAKHVDDQHRMTHRPYQPIRPDQVAPACAVAPAFGAFDHFAKRQPVGQAGQAVAKHFGAQRFLRLNFDRSIDQADQAPAPAFVVARQRRQLDPVMDRPRPVAVAEFEFARGVVIGQIGFHQSRDLKLAAFAEVAAHHRRVAGRRHHFVEHAVAVDQLEYAAAAQADDRRGDRKRVEQVVIAVDVELGMGVGQHRGQGRDARGIAPLFRLFRSLHPLALISRG